MRLPLKSAPLAPGFSWTGFYLGVDVGYAWGSDSTTEYLTGTNTLTGLIWDYSQAGAVGGLFVAANY